MLSSPTHYRMKKCMRFSHGSIYKRNAFYKWVCALSLRPCDTVTFFSLQELLNTIAMHTTFTAHHLYSRASLHRQRIYRKAVASRTHSAHTHTHTHTHVVRTAPVRSVKSVLKTAAGGTKGGDAGKWHLLSPRWPFLTHGWQPHRADLLIKRSLALSRFLSPPLHACDLILCEGLKESKARNEHRERQRYSKGVWNGAW